MAAEDASFAAGRVRYRADVIVDGAPAIPHEAEKFVRLDRSRPGQEQVVVPESV